MRNRRAPAAVLSAMKGPHPSVSLTLFGLAAVAALVACAPTGSSDGPSGSEASQRPARSLGPVQSAPESAAPIIGEVPQAILDPILADASQRTGVAIEELEITTAVAETWTDGSLGCPEPGMMYTQALVDGYQVVIDAAGDVLDYRVGNGGAFILCEQGGAPSG